MSIAHEIEQSRSRVMRWWPLVAERCSDPRLSGSTLQPVEGMNGHRSDDLDRRSHIDHFAVIPGRWTPLSTRFQSREYARKRTATFRRTEVNHLRKMYRDHEQLGADLHVHMYGDDTQLLFVVVAALAPVARYYTDTRDEHLYWLYAPDGNPFNALTPRALAGLDALVWTCDPTKNEALTLFGEEWA
jgi:hypothetical protein